MRVLEATDFYYPWIAGPAPLIKNLSEGLAGRGHEVVIACPSPTGSAFTESGNPEVNRVKTWRVPFGYQLRGGAPFVHLHKLVRDWRPDIIHIHHPFPISAAAVVAAKTNRVPILATNHTIPECSLYGLRGTKLHTPARLAFGRHINFLMNRASIVATPTRTAAKMLTDIGFKREIISVSNGVDTQCFRPSPSAEPQDRMQVLYTGRLDAEKDVATLLRAVPSIVSRIPSIDFRIGGEGTERTRLERLARDLGIDSHVRFTGYVPLEALPTVYREAGLYVMTSPVELQSISTLEAMASGLPVVAVEAGALPELVRPGINGYLTDTGDSRMLGDAIVSILSNQALRVRMGAESRKIAEGHSVEAMISRYEALFQRLVGERVPRTVYRTAHS